jgi:hypothetical protein
VSEVSNFLNGFPLAVEIDVNIFGLKVAVFVLQKWSGDPFRN